MFRFMCKCGLAIALCVILQTAAASEKNPVTRPLKLWSDVNVFNLVTGEYWSTGHATNYGRFYNSQPAGAPYGILTTASGDEIWWTSKVAADLSSFTVTIFGGTGRFEHATGYFEAVVEDAKPDFGTGIMTLSYTAEGTITY